jgi:ribosome biogenesis protein BMS1
MVDRIEDITNMNMIKQNNKCDRDVMMFGYVRGTHLKEGMKIHLIGAGDFYMHSIATIPDPCPLPNSTDDKIKRSSLKMKETMLYAPMANVGRVQISDSDGVYIELSDIHYTKKEHLQLGNTKSYKALNGNKLKNGSDDPANNAEDDLMNDGLENTPVGLLRSMQDVRKGVDELIQDAEMSLFVDSKKVKSSDLFQKEDERTEDDYDNEQDDDDDYNDGKIGGKYQNTDEEEDLDGADDDFENELDGDDSYDDDDDNEGRLTIDGQNYLTPSLQERNHGDQTDTVNWKDNMKEKALKSFLARAQQGKNYDLMEFVYGKTWKKRSDGRSHNALNFDMDKGADERDDDDEDDDELFTLSAHHSSQAKYKKLNALDSNRLEFNRDPNLITRLQQWRTYFDSSERVDEDDANMKIVDSIRLIKNKFVTGDWDGAVKPGDDTA